jgi:ATPase complex subunit ATP10
MARPYFRDWGNLQFHEGKSFLAPPRLFKAESSLFFPNLYGQTILKSDKKPRDTTPALQGKASVVSIFSSKWAEDQADSFTSKDANPALHDVLAKNPGVAQLVRVNYENNAGKAWLIKLFMGGLRRRLPECDWDKYFLVQRGITDNIRESIGLLNAKVGYTYIVDQHCRIRWAGSGSSNPDERESLAKGLARVVSAIQQEAAMPAAARETLASKRQIEATKLPAAEESSS